MKESPKWRPVFGQKLPSGFKPPTPEEDRPSGNKSSTNGDSGRDSVRSKPNSKSAADSNSVPLKKLKPKAWADYFVKMNPTERILLAFTAFIQPVDTSVDQFTSYNHDSFRNLDTDLPGPTYQEIVRILTKWTKVGFLVVGRYANSLSLKEGVAGAFWKFIDKQADPVFFEVEPEQSYTADLPGTLDNLFNFLVMVEQGEVLITRTHEINKHSLKRVLSGLTQPALPHKLFSPERYFYWLMGVAQFFQLFWSKGDRLVLTTPGRELPERFKVEDLLAEILPTNFRSMSNKGFFLMLPLLVRCTVWTSWGHLVSTLFPADNSFNLLRLDRVISMLDPMRFLGLIDWGEHKGDILVRTTPLGQFLISKMLQGKKLEDYTAETKSLTDPVYPMNGPDTAYVQPNFEILLPRSASWTTRWELSQFAVLEQQDQMFKYRLDKTYLLNALKRGLPADEVLALLTKLSPYPLPENLVLTIQQWVESFGQVTFMQFSLLECTTPEQAASIASSRKYKEYVLGLYSATAVIVREPEKLRKLLEKQGIYPLPGILDGERAAKRKVCPTAE